SYEQKFSKNRRTVYQDRPTCRQEEYEKRTLCGKKGVEIRSVAGWQNQPDHASAGRCNKDDPAAEPAGAAGGRARDSCPHAQVSGWRDCLLHLADVWPSGGDGQLHGGEAVAVGG